MIILFFYNNIKKSVTFLKDNCINIYKVYKGGDKLLTNDLTTKTDQELYQEFLKGNQEAFNLIVKIYRMQVIAFIMKYVRNFDVAEDLAQDVFLYMLVNKKEYDFKYTLKTYLYTIAKCRAINYIKKNQKQVFFDENSILAEDDLDDILIQQENKKILLNAIKKLKGEYRVILYLREIKEFQYKEIGKILNKTIPQVKMSLYRARKALSKVLRKGSDMNEK